MTPIYRPTGVALLCSSVFALTDTPTWWPDPDDREAVAGWLRQVWSGRDLVEAIRQASPTLAGRVDAICAGHVAAPLPVRRAGLAVAGYLLRATGRPTPFGLFAGVAAAGLGGVATARLGSGHRPCVRVDTQWIAGVIDGWRRARSCWTVSRFSHQPRRSPIVSTTSVR